MLKLLKGYVAKYWNWVCLTILFVFLQIIIQTVFLMAETKNILDNGVAMGNMELIQSSGIKMLLFDITLGVFAVFASYTSARVTAGVTCDIRKDCFNKVIGMSSQDYNKFGVSTLLTRTTSDEIQIQMFLINFLRGCLVVPVIIVCMLVMIYQMNTVLFWVLFVSFAVSIFVLVYFGVKSKVLFEELQLKIDRINLLMKEKMSGMRAIRAFCNQNLEEEKLSKANEEAYETAVRANEKINFLAPMSLVIMNWVVVLIYFLGSKQLQLKMASISDLLLIFQYLAYFISSLSIIPTLVNMLPKVSVSCQRISELLAYKPENANCKDERKDGITDGRIEFNNVIFGYSGATNVIADISFVAEAGKTTAFIGTTGSGKTTIMNLILRLYQMTFGEIKIDGISIKDFDPDYLRKRISYGTQKSMVFYDTVFNNISAYDSSCTKQRVEKASDAAEFSEVLVKLPNGLESQMAQGGMNISGGQRQRLSLARTVAKDAAIYIFDDTFSALDAKTEASARQKIGEMLVGKTVLMVAQKISTIVDADKIIVLDKGRIAGQGTHEELLKSCREYQEIYRTQCYMNKEEM